MPLSPLGHHLFTMACNNAWANHRLQKACAKLSQDDFVARRTSFFPSIKATLNHILTVDWFYVDALEGGTLGPTAWDVEEPFDDIAALAAEQAKVDRRLVALCEPATREKLASTTEIHRAGRIQRERMEDVLNHLFQHQTHHRGQVHAMLAGTSVHPPQLDEFIVADDGRFRSGDIAALGWSEEQLMR